MKISVIVPVYNAEVFIKLCLDALITQSYSNYNIIVVDNGSTDDTCKIVKTYNTVTLLHQNDIQSSYGARNVGISHATGEILAFTDADCIPNNDWLDNSASYFKQQNCDMLGGRISFFYSKNITGAEVLDSLVNMQNHKCISERGVAKTANFFAKKAVFRILGNFPEVISGGDVMFTEHAVKKGYSLLYADDTIVKHPARQLGELLIKSWRTGSGAIAIKKTMGKPSITKLCKELLIVSVVPPNPFKWRQKISSLPIQSGYYLVISTVFSLYLVKVVTKLSALVAFLIPSKHSL